MVRVEEKIKAIILAGGYGTRLRPLTYTVPKPLVPFANKPILRHQVEALAKAGIKQIVLALNYHSDLIIKEAEKYSRELCVDIIYSKEQETLGTAGPIALARKYLEGCPFFVLNSDITCDFPLKELIDFHLSHGKEGTILSTVIDDPSKYGLILLEEGTNFVKLFLEKPEEITTNRINAGIYVLNPSFIDRVELKECSIERDIFPQMVLDGQLCAFDLKGFWMDLGQPMDYIKGQELYLRHSQKTSGNCPINNPEELLAKNNVVIGKNVKIGKNVHISNSTIFDNVEIGDDVIIRNSIVGWNAKVEDGVKIDNCSILGFSVNIKRFSVLNSARVSPNEPVCKFSEIQHLSI